jgi:beclin 1
LAARSHVASVPALPQPSTLSRTERLAQIPTPSSTVSKQAYLAATSSASPSGNRRSGGLGPAESFVLLNNSAVLPPSPTATSQRPTSPSSNAVDKPTKHALSTELLQLVSARTDTDHPLCAECARLLQEVLADKLDVVGLERDAYLAFERRIKDLPNGGRKSQDEMRELERRLEEVRPLSSPRAAAAAAAR